jgi:eukaryotic-like serine/threonine-protein kinase
VAFAVENICGFLIRSRLMTPEEMRNMQQRWQAAAGADAKQVPAFLKWLVATGYVTEYQAGLLGQGHADDFFLNQYKILERIGRGRMAGVFKAVHNLGQIVAIKVLPPSRAKTPQLLARFQREASLSLRLKHPNVVRSFQVGEANGVHYLVMEHLEGETLDDVLRRRRVLPPEEAVRLAHQTLLGLQHIHEQGMVHRDIKPANLFLQSLADAKPKADYCVKILDIGLAREFFEETSTNRAATPRGAVELTAEGVLLGTPDYLAPEQARDPRRSDIRADIYSVGCVLYHMLVGQAPFPDHSLFNQIVRHATETPKPLRSFNPAIPEGLEQIVAWMMAKQPDQRYPTPARAAQALDVFLLMGDTPAAEEPPQMRKFLTWLELEDKAPRAESAPSAAAPGKPKLSPAVPAVAASEPALARARGRKTPAPAIKKAPLLPAAATQPALDIDVELVATPESAAPVILQRSAANPKKNVMLIVMIVVGILLFCSCAGLTGWLVRGFQS